MSCPEAGFEQGDGLVHVSPGRGRADPETGRELGERLTLAQVRQDQQGLPPRVQLPPARPARRPVTADGPGHIAEVPGLQRKRGTVESMEGPGGEADLVDCLNYQGLLWSQQQHCVSSLRSVARPAGAWSMSPQVTARIHRSRACWTFPDTKEDVASVCLEEASARPLAASRGRPARTGRSLQLCSGRVLPPSLFERPAAELSVDDSAQLCEDRRQTDHIA